ncbi:hypothetical protein COUCH_05495 [Couchioplanes caeruleus]|uniref:hypothetical protein n=1 Tax=Couchioplanes caeruleus TaxID=56438 RepID=UPI0020C17872|nr:hypothetical protein [Couchioplanes caeruleus]UQU65774.1 hypothetical protein COUCH_05495 [Couchioplanes caeruleus]
MALLLAGGAAGVGTLWAVHDPHTAKPEHLVGVVDWSNQSTNTISFRADGQPPTGEQVFYRVVSSTTDYPGCLVGNGSDPVRQDKRRVELDTVRADYGGKQPVRIAMSLLCKD